MTLNDWNTANWIRPKSNVDKKWVLVRKVFAGGGAGAGAGAGGIQKFFILVEGCVVGGRWGGGVKEIQNCIISVQTVFLE